MQKMGQSPIYHPSNGRCGLYSSIGGVLSISFLEKTFDKWSLSSDEKTPAQIIKS